jgi:hypothetical protein
MISSEFTSSRIWNTLQRNVNAEYIVEKTTDKLVNHKQYEKSKPELLDIMNSNINEYCVNAITFL